MFRISCFADEISPELDEQAEVVAGNGVRYVELRSVWDKNVLDLTDDELDHVKERFARRGIGISSIGSPVGKTEIGEDFGGEMERFGRAVDVALRMECRFIRVFSFYMDEDSLESHRDAVVSRLGWMLRLAREKGITLLHENEAGIYGQHSARCLELFKALPDSHLMAAFDPSNFVVAGEAVLTSFERLRDHIGYMHIKDSMAGTGEIVVAGRGDGRIREILDGLRDREGLFLSLEPHLSCAGKYRGFSGPELFREDLEALRGILGELDIPFE